MCVKKHLALNRSRPRHKAACRILDCTRETNTFKSFRVKLAILTQSFMRLIIGMPTISSTRQSISLEKYIHNTVERMNRLLRNYLAKFARKTYCCSKSLQMIKYSLMLFMHRDFIEYVKV